MIMGAEEIPICSCATHSLVLTILILNSDTNEIKPMDDCLIKSLLFWKKAQELFCLINNAHEFT